MMNVEAFEKELEGLLNKIGVDTAVIDGVEPQAGKTLRALMPVTKQGDIVLTEVMLAPYTEETLYVQIYSTMILEIGPGYQALKEMILDWNLSATLGAFGIYRKERQLYHKYGYIIPVDAEPDEMAAEIFYLMSLVTDVISTRFEDAVRISGHK